MIPKKQEKSKDIIYSCNCGYNEKLDENKNIKVIEKIDNKKEITAIEKDIEIYPITNEVECPKCGNNTAYYWEVQTRASDEPATKFYKCEKCKYIWRDYK